MKCTPNHTMSAALGASWTFLLCELNHSFLVSNLLVSCLMPFKLFWYRLLLCPNTVRALGICISSIYLQQNPSSRSRSKTLSQGAMHWPESCLPATALWATGGELPCLFLQTLPEATLYPFPRKMGSREFPGGPVIRTRCFHCQGPGFPGQGTKIPQAVRSSWQI